MRGWKYLLVTAMALCLMVPAILWADDEEPEAMDGQAASFQNAAQAQHAANVAVASFSDDDFNAANITAANTLADEAKNDYADKTATKAIETMTENLADAVNPDRTDPEWQEAFDLNYDQVYADNYQTEKDLALASDEAAAVRNDAYDDALSNPDSPAYQEEYAKAVADITGVKIEEIQQLRMEYGWGEIAKMFGVHPSVLGLGHQKKFKGGMPLDPEVMLLEDEIAEATRRNTRTGWNEEPGYKAKNKNGYNKKYGLAQTSGAVTSDVKGNKGGNKSKKSTSTQSASNNSRGNTGNSKAKGNSGVSNGNSGNKGNKGNSGNNGNNGNSGNNGNKGGDKGNNGNKGGNSGNNGNNGNNGGGNGNNGGGKGKK